MPLESLLTKAKPLYSSLEEALANLTRNKGTGAEFLKELEKKAGVKQSEIQDRGLDKVLADLPKVDKVEVQKAVRKNPSAKVEVTTKMENPYLHPDFHEIRNEVVEQHTPYDDYGRPMRRFSESDADEMAVEALGGPAKYYEHQLPNSKNYREMLLQLPEDSNPYKNYYGPHWDEPNVLAHMRLSDRAGPNGEKVLHLEELQSDWHQEARDKGYQKPATKSLSGKVVQNKSHFGFDPDYQVQWEDGTFSGGYGSPEEAQKRLEQGKTDAVTTGVPDAPFKKNWEELALKHLINHAVDNGYDKIAITPGAVQADRYDLSKQIANVEYNELGDLRAYDHNGRRVLSQNVLPEKVSDYVGKELGSKIAENHANRIQARSDYRTAIKNGAPDDQVDALYQQYLSHPTEYSGLDLQVGGEGMKAAYDQRIPNILNKLGKPFGAQTEMNAMPVETGKQIMVPDNAGLGMISSGQPETANLHSFDITPELKQQVQTVGLPAYKKGGAVKITDNPDAIWMDVQEHKFAEGGKTDSSKPAFVYPNPRINPKFYSDINDINDPRTLAFVKGLLGSSPDELGTSVFNPNAQAIRQAGEAGYAGSIAGDVLPMASATKIPQAMARTGLEALSEASMGQGNRFLRSIVPQPLFMMPNEKKAKETVNLFGALKPENVPVRGETSKELLKAQKKQLTDEQKETLERIKQQSPTFAEASKFMTPQEVGKIISNPDSVSQLTRLLDVLPSAKELSSVAKAGAPKQGWYRASTQALMDVFGPEDAPRFASLLAAMSPQTSVEMNLLNTLNTWKNWTAAGRPTDAKSIKAIMGASVLGNKGEESVLDAWVNNATRSLSAEDPLKVTLSGPKVDSFYRNLADDVYRVTNDAWMSNGLGVAQDMFSGSPTALQIAKGDPGLTPGYIGTSARLREAGQRAGLLPSEAQETTWSTFMPLYEMQASLGIPAREILQKGLLTPDVIRGTPDFATLLSQGAYGDILKSAGYENELSKLKPTPFTKSSPSLSLSEQRDMINVAKRLENLKSNREMESRAKLISLPADNGRAKEAFAYATPEYIPGLGTGHLEGLISEPLGTRQYHSSRIAGVFQNPSNKDILQSSLDLNPLETRLGTGAYRPAGEIPFQGTLKQPTTARNPMETNPMFPTGVSVPVKRGANVSEDLLNKLEAIEGARGYMTVQNGSPFNIQVPHPQGESLFVPLKKKATPENMGYTSQLTNDEVSLADTGKGVSILNWGSPLNQFEQNQLVTGLGGTTSFPTKNISRYVDFQPSWQQGYGSGTATRQLLDLVDKLEPADQLKLSKAMQQPAADLADIYEQLGQRRDEPVREDLMRGLRIIAKGGLPALGSALAAGEALAGESNPDAQQK
jgi:hypothetical protein